MTTLTYSECLSWLAAWGRGYCDRDELYAAVLSDVSTLRELACDFIVAARYEETQEAWFADVPPQGRGFWRAYWTFGALLCRETVRAIRREFP